MLKKAAAGNLPARASLIVPLLLQAVVATGFAAILLLSTWASGQ